MTAPLRVLACVADAPQVARLVAALAPMVAAGVVGAPTTARRLEGDEDGVVVILGSWNLLAAAEIFGPTAAAAVGRHRVGTCRLVLLVLDDVLLDGTPLADLPRVDAVGSWDAAVAAVRAAADSVGMPGLLSPAARDTPVPAYAEDASRQAGEALFAWQSMRARGDAVEEEQVASLYQRLRRGARLRPGEFVDATTRLLRLVAPLAGDEIWRAWDLRSRRVVSVRVFLDPWTHDAGDVDEMIAATHRLSVLDDAGLVRPLAAGRTDDGFVWQSSEVPPAAGLSDVTLRRAAVLQAALEVARTLGRCHAQGIVHGAVSPSTIGLRSDGSAVLHGFSPPPALRARSRGGVFEPPESVAGRALGPQGDVYALALSVVAALYGEELPLWALRGLDRLIGSLPVTERVRKLLATATDWDPDRRGDVGAFVDALLGDADTVADLAADALAHGRATVAVEHLERSLRSRPGSSGALRLKLGEIYCGLGEVEAAAVHLLAALHAAEDPGPVVARLGQLLAAQNPPGDLVDLLQNAVRTADAPHRAAALRAELARTLDVLGRHGDAATCWEGVLADHRNPAVARDALSALVRHAVRSGDNALLERTDELHVRLSQAPLAAAAEIGVAWDALGDPDRALRWLEIASAGALDERNLNRLVVLRRIRGQWREAVVPARESHDAAEVARVAWMAFAAHDGEVAEELVLRWQQLEPDAPAAAALSLAIARLRQTPADMRAVSRLGAEDAVGERVRLARLCVDRGDWQPALDLLAEVPEPAPVAALRLRAAAYAALGRPESEECWRALAEASVGGEDEVDALLGWSDASWACGHAARSAVAASRALRLDPARAAAVWALARAALSGDTSLGLPGRVSPCEPLATALAGQIARADLEAWVREAPWGRLVAEHAPSSHRLALAAADLLARQGQLFDFVQLAARRRPDLAECLADVVSVLDGQPLGDRAALAMVAAPASATPGGSVEALLNLCRGPTAAAEHAPAEVVVALVADGATRAVLLPGLDVLQLGTASGATCVSDSDQLMPRHARLWRAGALVYVEAVDGGVEVNGRPVGASRVLPGDVVLIGGARLDVRAFASEDDLPPFEVVVPSPRRRIDSDVSDERTDERQAKVQMHASPPALGQVQLTAELEIKSGPQRGRRQRIADVVTVGAGPGNVVRLTADDEVDDHHFDVRVEGGRFVLGVRSPRGVLVSGRPGRDGGELTGGETLMAGRTVLAFRVRAATATR